MSTIDIVILAHDQAKITHDCLRNLATVPAGVKFRVVLVDNGSGRDVRRLCRWWWMNTRKWVPWARYRNLDFTYIKSDENIGFSRGNNLATAQCRSPWLVFMNNDAFPQVRGWLRVMLDTACSRDYTAVGPTSNAVLGLQHVVYNSQYPARHQAKFLSGFCMLIKRSVFEAVGGWDDRFFNGDEDLDLSIKLRKSGYKIGVTREVYVTHLNQSTLRGVAEKAGKTAEQWYKGTRKQLVEKWGEWVCRDLFNWSTIDLPPEKRRERGVFPNGFFNTAALPGDAHHWATRMGELQSRLPERGARGSQATVGKLHSPFRGADRDTYCADCA